MHQQNVWKKRQKSDIFSNDVCLWLVLLLKVQMFFTHFASANQLPGFSIAIKLGSNELTS